MKIRFVLIALGFAVAAKLLLVYGRNLAFHSRSTSSNSWVAEKRAPQPTSAPNSSSSRITELPTSLGLSGASGKNLSMRPESPGEFSRLHLKLTESSDPAANQLFRDCFRLMDQGNYREAEVMLTTYGNGKRMSAEDEFVPYAVWLSAWCMFKQGGSEKKLADAAQVFSLYGNGYYNHDEELEKAAWINRALIYRDLLYTNSGKQDDYIKGARYSLNLFLEKWPNDPKAPGIRNLLDSIDSYHPSLKY